MSQCLHPKSTDGQIQVLKPDPHSAFGPLSLSFPSHTFRAINLTVQPKERIKSHTSTAGPWKACSMMSAALFASATYQLCELEQIT